MTSLSIKYHVLGIAVMACASLPLGAQTSPNDSLFRRAKRQVAEGKGGAGRALVDSLLRGAHEGTPTYGDALYWRGALAETAADAERDYRRVIVEYPLSTYADNALLAMADLESARGDRAGALQHLQRFVKEHPVVSPARGTAALSAARLAFEQRDTRAACNMVSAARASTPVTNVETRNQIDYLATRCVGMEVASAPSLPPAPGTATKPAPPVRDSASRTSTRTVATTPKPIQPTPTLPLPVSKADSSTLPAPPVVQATQPLVPPRPHATVSTTPVQAAPTPARRGTYTIQLAAYNTRVDAARLVAKLKTKGVNARISGEVKPFRVRLDFYPTRQAAQDEVNALKARGIVGFVATETPPPPATS